jgi:hypothetical protein
VSAPAKPPEADEEKPPWHLEIPTHEEVFVGELAERGDWIVANIQTGVPWPVNAQKVMYRGCSFWILPVMRDYYPAIAMKVPPGKSRAECDELLMRFVSNLSWVVGDWGIMVDGIGGGTLPRPMGRDKWSGGFSIRDEFDLSYFPEQASEDALLALALMREGRGLNHAAYAFLSFFRILEVAFPNSKKRKAWVEANVTIVEGHGVKDALDGLANNGITDIGRHLFESGRCAVAHANRKPIIDPDKPDDLRRLSSELPIIRALAQKAIEDELGVETSQTVYRKHLYELAGFKEILGGVDRRLSHPRRAGHRTAHGGDPGHQRPDPAPASLCAAEQSYSQKGGAERQAVLDAFRVKGRGRDLPIRPRFRKRTPRVLAFPGYPRQGYRHRGIR